MAFRFLTDVCNATKVKKGTEGQPNTAVSENPAVYEKTGILRNFVMHFPWWYKSEFCSYASQIWSLLGI